MKGLDKLGSMIVNIDKSYVLRVLSELDKEMAFICFSERPDRSVTEDEVTSAWEQTVWHKMIMKKMEEIKSTQVI